MMDTLIESLDLIPEYDKFGHIALRILITVQIL
jgi:hypothetical protein